MGDLNDDNDPLSIWDHLYNFAGTTIKIHEDYDAGLGGTLFDGAALACNYFEYLHGEDPKYFENQRVIELGAGCGLPGLLVGALGASYVSLTDIEQTVELLEENIEDNEKVLQLANSEVKGEVLDWTNESDRKRVGTSGPFDTIIAADTIYDTSAVEPFISTVLELSGPDTVVVFSHPSPRVPAASKKFWDLVMYSDDSPFNVEKIPHQQFCPNGSDGHNFQTETNGIFCFKTKVNAHVAWQEYLVRLSVEAAEINDEGVVVDEPVPAEGGADSAVESDSGDAKVTQQTVEEETK